MLAREDCGQEEKDTKYCTARQAIYKPFTEQKNNQVSFKVKKI